MGKKIKIGLLGSSQIYHIKLMLEKKYDVKIINQYQKVNGRIKKILAFIKEVRDVDVLYNVFTTPRFIFKAFILKIMRKKVFSHWIGTDTYNFINNKMKYQFLNLIDIHFACSEDIKRELNEKNLKSLYLPIFPAGMNLNLGKMPKNHAVLLYMPNGREDFYGYKSIKYIIEKYPELLFYIVANDNKVLFPYKNVILKGYLSIIEMEKVYDEISIVLRFPKHDGLSMMVIEGLGKGKSIIYNYSHPYINCVKTETEICNALDEIICKEPLVNYEGHRYVQKNYNNEEFLLIFMECTKTELDNSRRTI